MYTFDLIFNIKNHSNFETLFSSFDHRPLHSGRYFYFYGGSGRQYHDGPGRHRNGHGGPGRH